VVKTLVPQVEVLTNIIHTQIKDLGIKDKNSLYAPTLRHLLTKNMWWTHQALK